MHAAQYDFLKQSTALLADTFFYSCPKIRNKTQVDFADTISPPHSLLSVPRRLVTLP